MKQLSHRTGAKLAAWLLLAADLLLLVCSALGVAFLAVTGSYFDSGAGVRDSLLLRYCQSTGENVYWAYCTGADAAFPTRTSSNFAFALTDSEGRVLAENWQPDKTQYTYTRTYAVTTGDPQFIRQRFASYTQADEYLAQLEREYEVPSSGVNHHIRYGLRFAVLDPDGEATPTPPGGEWLRYFDSEDERAAWLAANPVDESVWLVEETDYSDGVEVYAECYTRQEVTLTCWIPDPLTAADSLYYQLDAVDLLLRWRSVLPVVLGLSAVLGLLLTVFLFFGAGRRADGSLHPTWFDRLPLELLPALDFLAVSAVLACLSVSGSLWMVLFSLALAVPALLWCLLTLLSLAVRIKAGRLWHSTLLWHVWRLLARIVSGIGRAGRYLADHLPLVWQAALGWALLCVVELILIAAGNGDPGPWLLARLLLTPVVLLLAIQLAKLRRAASEIAAGNLHTQVDLRYMAGPIRQHGADLNNITAGLQSAVEQRLRSERLKTELITNVSHDIKTPLTSIVNYVDLLSREEMPSAEAKEYLAVLQHQSARLRKLTEDLVEASKAATGNIDTHPERMDAGVMLSQTAGEYEETLRSLELEPVLALPGEPLEIIADGRLLWRVFDNLMTNIRKYAMPGTRVYLSCSRVGEGGREVEILFRNISRYPLNISSDELMERFVRGDSSRSTEGSGLGLSIARSLTELQGGSFTITVDGDLFKASVRFPAAPPA